MIEISIFLVGVAVGMLFAAMIILGLLWWSLLRRRTGKDLTMTLEKIETLQVTAMAVVTQLQSLWEKVYKAQAVTVPASRESGLNQRCPTCGQLKPVSQDADFILKPIAQPPRMVGDSSSIEKPGPTSSP